MATPSMSLQRWLAHDLLRSFDEEDLMALTEAIVLEVASRRSGGQQPQCDEPASHTSVETRPRLHGDVLDILAAMNQGTDAEHQKLLEHLAEPQEESPNDT